MEAVAVMLESVCGSEKLLVKDPGIPGGARARLSFEPTVSVDEMSSGGDGEELELAGRLLLDVSLS